MINESEREYMRSEEVGDEIIEETPEVLETESTDSISNDETGSEESEQESSIESDYSFSDFTAPEEFESSEAELEFYKGSHGQMMDYVQSDKFSDSFINKYKDVLIEQEQASLQKILEEGDQHSLVRQYPEFASKIGINPVLTPEQMKDEVKYKLQEEFGSDSLGHFNPQEQNDPNTLSGKMLQKQEQIIDEIEKRNEHVKTAYEDYKPPSQSDIQKELDNQYKDFEKELTKEEFNAFKEKALGYTKSNKVTLKDMQLIMNREKVLQSEYERGLKDGKKNLVQDIKRTGTNSRNKMETQKEKPVPEDYESYHQRNSFGL